MEKAPLKKLLSNSSVCLLKEALGEESALHIVGGAIRDSILARKIKDIDLATKFTPEETISKLTEAGIRYIPIGIRRGTIAAYIDGECFEITTFRNPQKETQYTQTIEEDLPARDFTINAIALSVNSGDIIDPFDGEGDLKNNILKAVGDPTERFTEDPHRILRMIRFGTAQGREIDPNTFNAGKKLSPYMSLVSTERINVEFTKILCSEFAELAIRQIHELGLLKLIIPELVDCVGLEQNKYHTYDVFGHTLAVVDNCPREKIVRLAALFHDIGKPCVLSHSPSGARQFLEHEGVSTQLTKTIMRRLKYSKEEVDRVALLVETHMKPIQMGKRGIRRLLQKLGDELDNWLALKYADVLGGRVIYYDLKTDWNKLLDLIEEEKNFKQVSKYDLLAVSGKDVMSLGVKEGPEVGKILKILQELVLDDPHLNTSEFLLNKINILIKENHYD